jgi:hypothetical protein
VDPAKEKVIAITEEVNRDVKKGCFGVVGLDFVRLDA